MKQTIVKNIATGITKKCDILKKNNNFLEVVLEGTTIKLTLKRKSDVSKKLSLLIKQKILNNALVKSFTLAKHIHGIMFTKSSKGMSYGRHIDNAYMSSGRADLSFTIFLSEKNQYKGGELLIENLSSESEFKLDRGEILIYPSTYLHSVKKILNGERIVCVGWIESYVKSIEERE